MPLDLPSVLPPLGPQTEPDKVRVAAVVGGMLGAAPARGFGLTPDELTAVEDLAADGYQAVTAETRNRIVNGAMQISQENGDTAGTTLTYHAADQWFMDWGGTSVVSFQRVQSVTPNGSQNRLRMTVTTIDATLAASDRLSFQQLIEGTRIADFGWGTAAAKQIVVRFGFKAPAGNYALRIANGAVNRSFVVPFTIAAGQANSDTVQTFIVPGDTTGTWLVGSSGTGMYLTINVAASSTFVGVAGWQAGNMVTVAGATNGVGIVNSVYELFDVGLYCDPLATGIAPPWVMPDEAEELRACQRYYAVQYSSIGASAAGAATVPYFLPVAMRTTPAVSNRVAGTINGGTSINVTMTGSTAGYLNATFAGVGNYVLHRGDNFNARM